jgi:hypothetical protein
MDKMMAKIKVENTEISIVTVAERDYISLTDMANAKESESRAADIIKNWLRTRYTLEFLGTWELIHNPDFKVVEFDHFKMSQSERLVRLNKIAIQQMRILQEVENKKLLK